MSTFVVRVHHSGPSAFRGEVRHVPTGAVMRFTNAPQLLAFLEELNGAVLPAATAAPPAPAPGRGAKPRRPARS